IRSDTKDKQASVANESRVQQLKLKDVERKVQQLKAQEQLVEVRNGTSVSTSSEKKSWADVVEEERRKIR
ncbi:hypothetical protein HAX54_030812, partial [Datura stramonium]|nr:hypothetical protein [Datura stramonium]